MGQFKYYIPSQKHTYHEKHNQTRHIFTNAFNKKIQISSSYILFERIYLIILVLLIDRLTYNDTHKWLCFEAITAA